MPFRTMKLSGADGLVSFSGTAAVHPERSRPLKSGVTRAGVIAWPGADACSSSATAAIVRVVRDMPDMPGMPTMGRDSTAATLHVARRRQRPGDEQAAARFGDEPRPPVGPVDPCAVGRDAGV